SLVIDEMVLAIESRFGARIGAHQLLGEMNSIGLIAPYIAKHNPHARAHEPTNGHSAPRPLHVNGRSTSLEATTIEATDGPDDLVARYTRRTARSKELGATWRKILADTRAVAGFRKSIKELLYPIIGDHAQGSRLWDVDGNEYIDISMGFG